MESYLIRFFVLFAYYILGAYATTDILRLLKGNTTSVNAKDCYCPICGYKIPLSDQIPVFSYLKSKGKCQNCHSQIPFSDLFLEIFIFLGCSILTVSRGYSLIVFGLSIAFYEGTKLLYLIRKGVREDHFLSNLLKSLCNNLAWFLLLGFLFWLLQLVSSC